MRISTKTLATLLVVTAVAATVPGISRMPGSKRRQESQFDRLLQRHDRKGELRSDVLGLNPLEFRNMQKKLSFDEIAHRRGFANKRAFRLALLGKLKNELRLRGWTARRIDNYMVTRSGRMG
ncbi:MAG TPA: hypothetical protein VGO98_02340 [Candidatus Saccharimonadales bacterium]|nr:hypothetical protein [Candidatus Saccharimonadales bacterium]